jgi:GNAT superfamily N-acetyltransferase
MGFKIVTYTSHEDDFWHKMGPFFAFRSYAHEMGGWQFYSKPGSVWFVALLHNEVVGFCSIIQEKNHIYFDNFYVEKEHRNNGYSTILFKARLDFALSMKQEIRVITNNPIQLKRYHDHGFMLYGMRGKYSKFKYNAGKNSI